MVDIVAGRGVTRDGALAACPGVDRLGLFGRRDTEGNGFVVKEREAVVVQLAIEIDGAEAAGGRIPETLAEVGLNFAGLVAEIGRVERLIGRDVPIGVGSNQFFEVGKLEQRVVVVNRGERVFAAERQEVPVVAADTLARDELLLPVDPTDAAATFVAGPSCVDALSLARVELALYDSASQGECVGFGCGETPGRATKGNNRGRRG